MATGDQNDIFNRIKQYFPKWFNSLTPIFDAVCQAPAAAFSFVYGLYIFAKNQTRIRTMTDMDFLKLASNDFLGNSFPPRTDESVESYKNRLLANIFPYSPTREGMIQALTNLTGRAPIIYETQRDGGFLNQNAFLNHAVYGFNDPWTCFIIAYRPQAIFLNQIYALNQNAFLNKTAFVYNSSDYEILVSDQDIYNLIQKVKPYGTTCYVYISD